MEELLGKLMQIKNLYELSDESFSELRVEIDKLIKENKFLNVESEGQERAIKNLKDSIESKDSEIKSVKRIMESIREKLSEL